MTGGLRKLNFYLLAAVGVAALTSAGGTQAQAQDLQSLQISSGRSQVLKRRQPPPKPLRPAAAAEAGIAIST